MSRPLVLIIEDDPQLSKIFTFTLRDDFELETFGTGTQALERLANVVPHIIILDLHLPGISGSDILSNIRAEERLSKVIVILCTADNRQADYLRDKADFVLLKPVSPNQLRQLATRLK
jgi:CheY-like chemotaxis protein